MTRSPSFTSSGTAFRLHPTYLAGGQNLLFWFLLLAVSGMIIPDAETVPNSSSLKGRTTTRSLRGLIGLVFPDIYY